MHGAPFATYLAGGRGGGDDDDDDDDDGDRAQLHCIYMHSALHCSCIYAHARWHVYMYVQRHPSIYQSSFHAAYMHPHTHIIILNAYIYIYTHM